MHARLFGTCMFPSELSDLVVARGQIKAWLTLPIPNTREGRRPN